jgi:hypothetical protein
MLQRGLFGEDDDRFVVFGADLYEMTPLEPAVILLPSFLQASM